MAKVVDRWHHERPPGGAAECGEHKSRTRRMVPTSEHGKGLRWQARWYDESNEQRKKNFENKGPAETFLSKVVTDLAAGSYVDPKLGKIIMRSYAESWRKALVVDPTTAMNIKSRLDRDVYTASIADLPMGSLAKRPSLLQAWIKGMEDHLAASTIKGVVMWMSMMFTAAVDDGIITRNPLAARSVRRPRVEKKRVQPWTLEQVTAVGRELGQWEAMAYLGSGCGHRQGELFGVSLEDVDFLRRSVHVNRQVRVVDGVLVFAPPKGGKTRTVPLPASVGLKLSASIEAHPPIKVTLPWKVPTGDSVTVEPLFFVDGGAWGRDAFNRLWRRALKAAGVPVNRENGCHVLRHTAASAWLAAGVDIRTVAEFLGHSDPGFTLRVYSHLMPDAADRARKAMDTFFAPADSGQSALPVPSGGEQ